MCGLRTGGSSILKCDAVIIPKENMEPFSTKFKDDKKNTNSNKAIIIKGWVRHSNKSWYNNFYFIFTSEKNVVASD